MEWIPALSSLRRDGVNVAVVYVDPTDFGAAAEVQSPLDFLFSNDIPVYRVRRGQPLNEALHLPVYEHPYAFLAPVQPGESRPGDGNGSGNGASPYSPPAQYVYQGTDDTDNPRMMP